LRAARKLDPNAAHISFFLGVSHLMLGHDDTAFDALRATIELGDSPYLEEAHFYLAKAYLRRRDVGAAEAHLNQVIQLRGSESEEARRLLAGIERLKQRLD
jgi:lipoprotein NlpI